MANSTIALKASGVVATTTDQTAPQPALPVSPVLSLGDLMVMGVYSRTASASVSFSVDSDWIQITINEDGADGGRMEIWYKVWEDGDAAPTVSIATGAVGGSDEVFAQIVSFSGVNTSNPFEADLGQQVNASAANIGPITGYECPAFGAVVVLGGRRTNATSFAVLTGDSLTWVEISDNVSNGAGGSGSSFVWDYALNGSSNKTITDKTFTATGGSNETGRGTILMLNAAVWTDPKTWTVGEVVDEDEFNTYLRDNLEYLHQTRNALSLPAAIQTSAKDFVQDWQNDTTLSEVTKIGFDIAAGEQWAWIMFLVLSAGTTSDFKWTISVPTGASFRAMHNSNQDSFRDSAGTTSSGTSVVLPTTGGSTLHQVIITGWCSSPTVGGVVQLYAAESSNQGGGNQLTIHNGSYVIAFKIGG